MQAFAAAWRQHGEPEISHLWEEVGGRSAWQDQGGWQDWGALEGLVGAGRSWVGKWGCLIMGAGVVRELKQPS